MEGYLLYMFLVDNQWFISFLCKMPPLGVHPGQWSWKLQAWSLSLGSDVRIINAAKLFLDSVWLPLQASVCLSFIHFHFSVFVDLKTVGPRPHSNRAWNGARHTWWEQFDATFALLPTFTPHLCQKWPTQITMRAFNLSHPKQISLMQIRIYYKSKTSD